MNWICDKSNFKWCCWNEKLPLKKQIIMFLCTGSFTWYIKIKHQNKIIINKLMSISIMSKIQDITMVVFYFLKKQILVEGCTRRLAWWRDIYCSSLRSRSLCGSGNHLWATQIHVHIGWRTRYKEPQWIEELPGFVYLCASMWGAIVLQICDLGSLWTERDMESVVLEITFLCELWYHGSVHVRYHYSIGLHEERNSTCYTRSTLRRCMIITNLSPQCQCYQGTATTEVMSMWTRGIPGLQQHSSKSR